jgi:hypothetical protein
MQLTGLTVERSLLLEATDFCTLWGTIEAREVKVEVTNHSSLVLDGFASSVTGQATGFSSVDLTRLQATQIDVEVDGKSSLHSGGSDD